tara:strand:- start:428 stop:1603 length:1176 start_codon:yes stop_codon:yes gene_type:complete
MKENSIVILSHSRTPVGSFLGKLSHMSAPQLGSLAIKDSIGKLSNPNLKVDDVIMGNVLSGGLGQAPARQAAMLSGLEDSVHCLTINKVCGSGMKSIMLASEYIQNKYDKIVVAGGMESMSNAPHYVLNSRKGSKLGDVKQIDGLIHDGLWDVYNKVHMGNHGESCAEEYNISRIEQDDYAKQSYRRAQKAYENKIIQKEICKVVDEVGRDFELTDEEPFRVDFDKMSKLKSVFKKNGTITAANASTINDGAAACVLASEKKASEIGCKPVARILDYCQFSGDPKWFTTAPVYAIKKLLAKNNLGVTDIDFFEINEAFAVVPLVAIKKLKLNPEKVNVNGGAVSLGHPIGCSGTRIVTSLVNILNFNNKNLGLAAICIGGGEATAILIETM